MLKYTSNIYFIRNINMHKIYKVGMLIIFHFRKTFLHYGHLQINSKEIF